jgi:FkbM family methyltransferase
LLRNLQLALLLRYLRHAPHARGNWRIENYIRNHTPDCKLIVSTVHGFKMELETKDFIQSAIYVHGDWEPEIGTVIRRRLREGDVFVDVGANCGFFSLLAARLVGRRGRVLAIEPNPESADAIERNAVLNGINNIEVIRKAVGQNDSMLDLYVPANSNSGGASLVAREPSMKVIHVVVEPLDTILAKSGCPTPQLIKIDAEGAEVAILQGGLSTLSQSAGPALLLEISEYSLGLFGTSRADLFRILSEAGYRSTDLLRGPFVSRYSPMDIRFQFDVFVEK